MQALQSRASGRMQRANSNRRAASFAQRPVARPLPSSRQLCRAEEQPSTTEPQVTTPAPDAAPQAAAPQAGQAPILAKGQGTAIITGVISLVFGVAYLVLTAALDMRGGQMLPPPPEAFGP